MVLRILTTRTRRRAASCEYFYRYERNITTSTGKYIHTRYQVFDYFAPCPAVPLFFLLSSFDVVCSYVGEAPPRQHQSQPNMYTVNVIVVALGRSLYM